MILITSGLFYLVLKNRFMALDFDANYILSFIKYNIVHNAEI